MPPEKDARFSKAEGYERYLRSWISALASKFIDFARVRNGDRLLDVGSGTGALTLRLAASMPRSEIVGIAPSAPFIEFARTRTTDPRVHGGSYVKRLSPDLQEKLRERVRQNILGTRAAGSFSLKAQAVAVRGIH